MNMIMQGGLVAGWGGEMGSCVCVCVCVREWSLLDLRAHALAHARTDR